MSSTKNVVLKRSNDYSFQGEISADYKNQYFNDGGMNGNFRLSTPKMAFDVMYGVNNVKKMEYIDLDSKHTLKEELHSITQNEQLRSKYWICAHMGFITKNCISHIIIMRNLYFVKKHCIFKLCGIDRKSVV